MAPGPPFHWLLGHQPPLPVTPRPSLLSLPFPTPRTEPLALRASGSGCGAAGVAGAPGSPVREGSRRH